MSANNSDPFEILVEDHNEMYEYYDKLRSAKDFETKKQWLDKIHWELARHASAEELVLYPLIEKHLPKGNFLIQVALLEHEIIKQSLSSFERFNEWNEKDVDVKLFEKVVDRFMKDLKGHNDEEEQLQFPQLKEKLSQDELAKLADNLSQAKKTAPTHVHPSAPNKPSTGLGIVQPIQGAVDKLVDAVKGRPSQKVSSPAE